MAQLANKENFEILLECPFMFRGGTALRLREPLFSPRNWEAYGSQKFTTVDWITWQSENKQDDTISGLQHTFEVFNGMSLEYMVSTEPTYDCLYIKINGVQVLKVAGSTGWVPFTYTPANPIVDGTVQIFYSKDGSVSSNSDRVWIRNIKIK